MKSASAMKYGGELVDAVDCDYDSFKELIPLCPNCKEPVFLRIGGQRESAKGKAYQIGPHWCHFKGISKEQVAGCELRVNGYTEKDRAKIAAQARGQRLKLLQRWFWKILLQSPAFEGIEMQCNDIIAAAEKSNNTSFPRQLLGILKKKASANKYSYTRRIEVIGYDAFKARSVERWDTSAVPGHKEIAYSDRTIAYMQAMIDKHLTTERLFDIHKRMSQEAFLFLISHANDDIAKTVFLGAACMFIGLWKEPGSSVLRITANDTDGIIHFVTTQLMTIPWASEFQRLETEAKQRKGAA